MHDGNQHHHPAVQFLTDIEAAAILQVRPGTLRKWRHLGVGPAFRRHGRRVLYALSDLVQYSDSQRVSR